MRVLFLKFQLGARIVTNWKIKVTFNGTTTTNAPTYKTNQGGFTNALDIRASLNTVRWKLTGFMYDLYEKKL